MKKPQVIVVTIVALLILVLIFQNLQQVTSNLFFLPVTMPLALLIALVALLAYVAGVVTDGRVFRRPKGPLEQKAEEKKK